MEGVDGAVHVWGIIDRIYSDIIREAVQGDRGYIKGGYRVSMVGIRRNK